MVEPILSPRARRLTKTSVLALAAAAILPLATQAQAQSAAISTAPDADTVGAVTVTASRVNRAGYLAPTPTVVVGTEQLEQRGTTNVGAYLNEVPAFRPTTQPTTNGINQRSVGSVYVDMRGLGSSRTLVLVDGQRFVPEMAAGLAGYNVNLNQIPALLVERIEVVTGGASAQWGSDAVAGVVNVLLKKKFQGFQAEAQGGMSSHSDNKVMRFGFVAGRNFKDGRANLTGAVDFEKNYGVDPVGTRDWGKKHGYFMPNPCPLQVAVSATCPTGGNGQASNLLVNDVQFSNAAIGGVITAGPLKGTTFAAGGAQGAPFIYGNFVGATYMQGGGQPGVYYPGLQPIASPFWRAQSYLRGSYQFSDKVEGHLEASYSYSKGGGRGGAGAGSQTIQRDNAFLNEAVRQRMVAANVTSFTLGRYTTEFPSEGDIRNRTVRVVGGLDGEFGGAGDWKWSAAVGYGRNKYSQRVDGGGITNNTRFAVDAILVNGVATCRALVPGSSTYNPTAAAGCVPINLFGPNSITAQAYAYTNGNPSADIDYQQLFADAEISGEPFSTWAGPVSVAAGAQYRNEKEDAWSDPISRVNGYGGNNAPTFAGTYKVGEGFVETVVPLLKDSPVGESLDLNGAIRYADYAGAAGGQTTWKAGFTYKPFEGMLLRAARSRDIRAPNIFERNVPASGRNANVTYRGASPVIQARTLGNPNLTVEKADTTTFGFSYQPPFIPGLAFSVDRFKIDTKGLISTLSAQDVVDLCLSGQQSFCALLTFTNPATPTLPDTVSTPYLNLAGVEISGYDFQASYRFPLERLSSGLPGSLQFNFAGTYASHSRVNSGALGAVTIDRAGETGPKNQYAVPRFRSTANITYSTDRFSVGVNQRHVSAGNYDNNFVTGRDINNNRIGARTYYDLNMTYDVTRRISVFGVVSNVFDRAPPLAPTDNASPTNAAYFDVIGRMFRAGVRVKM